jgi:hypothetical protein
MVGLHAQRVNDLTVARLEASSGERSRPDCRKPVRRFFVFTRVIGTQKRDRHCSGAGQCGGWSEPLVLADANLTKARQVFVNATRQELGIESDASS